MCAQVRTWAQMPEVIFQCFHRRKKKINKIAFILNNIQQCGSSFSFKRVGEITEKLLVYCFVIKIVMLLVVAANQARYMKAV